MDATPSADATPTPGATPSLTSAQPEDALVARADERLAHAYGQIAAADEQLARVTEQLSKMERDASRQAFVPLPRRRPSRGRSSRRGLVGLLLAACIAGAAFVWQSPSGDAARLALAKWVPQLATVLPQEKPTVAAQADTPNDQMVADASSTTPPADAAQSIPQGAAPPPPAPMPPELTQSLAALEQHLRNLEQSIEQLKASQEQLKLSQDQLKASQGLMASDTARAIADLKAGQDQMSRQVVRASETRPRAAATAPPRPVPPRVQP